MNIKKIALQAVLLALSVSAYGQLRFSADEAQAMRKMQIALLAIENLYVDTTDTGKLAEDAIRGMISKLDPHSSYSTAKETKELNEPLQGNFDGIGVQFNIVDDTLLVVQTVHGGPSERVGIMAGDRIIAVNDTAIAGVKMSRTDIMKRLRGKKGTMVEVSVKRRGESKPIKFRIKRDKIPVKSMDAAYLIEPGIGYVRFGGFGANTHEEITTAIDSLREANQRDRKSVV